MFLILNSFIPMETRQRLVVAPRIKLSLNVTFTLNFSFLFSELRTSSQIQGQDRHQQTPLRRFARPRICPIVNFFDGRPRSIQERQN